MMESRRFEPDSLLHGTRSYLLGLPVHLGEVAAMPDGRWVDLCALALEANRTSRDLVQKHDVGLLAGIARQSPRFDCLEPIPLTSVDMMRPVLLMQRADGALWLLDGYRRVRWALTLGKMQLFTKSVAEEDAYRFILGTNQHDSASPRLEALALGVPSELLETRQERRRIEEGIGPLRPQVVDQVFKAGLVLSEKPRRICFIDEAPEGGRTTRSDKNNVQIALEFAIARVFYAAEALTHPSCGRQTWVARVKGPPFDMDLPKTADAIPALKLQHLPNTRRIVQLINAAESHWGDLDHTAYLDMNGLFDQDVMTLAQNNLMLLGIALRRANAVADCTRSVLRKAKRKKDLRHNDVATTAFADPEWRGMDIWENLSRLAHLAGFNPTFLWQQWQHLTDPLLWIVWGSAPVRGDEKTVTPPMAEAFIHQRLNEGSGERNVYSNAWALTNAHLTIRQRLDEAFKESIKQMTSSSHFPSIIAR